MEIAKTRHGVKLESEQNGNINPTPTKGSDLSQMTEHHSHSLTNDTSFTDNLIGLYEGCRDEMFELKKQNKLQKQEISQLRIEASKWRTIAECYITSWDSVQPEFKSLRAQIDSAEMREAEMRGEMKLMEMEREKERKRLEERENEVYEQRRKIELMEKERREMEMKLNQLIRMKVELKAPVQNGRLVSEGTGLSNSSEKVIPSDHIPKVCGSVASSAQSSSHKRLRRSLKSKILPNSVSQSHLSSKMNILPSPPKSSALNKTSSRPCVRNLIPLQLH